MKDFVCVVIPLLFIGGAGYKLAEDVGLVSVAVKPLRPLLENWLMLPAGAAIPLVFGFLQKDLTIGMLALAAGEANIGTYMTPVQMLVFGLVSTIQMPCVVAFSMACKEMGCRFAILLTVAALSWGLLISGVVAHLVTIAGL